MSVECTRHPRFDADLEDGVLVIDLNGSASSLIAGHLQAELQRRLNEGLPVSPSLVAFAAKLQAAAIQAEAVASSAAEPPEPSDDQEIRASSAAVFTIQVSAEGAVEVDATTKMGHLLARTLRDHRDWQNQQGYRLPPVVGAFGADLETLSRMGRSLSDDRPIAPLPPFPAATKPS